MNLPSTMKTNTPNLFIVGAPRSGTTALYRFLDQHPDIYMSHPKEPTYFCSDIHRESDEFHGERKYFSYRTEEDYLRIFEGARGEKIVGEASTPYLYSRVAAKKIHGFNPQAKIIIMLRNPVDLLYSLHSRLVRHGVEPIWKFEDALDAEDRRKAGKVPRSIIYPSSLAYRKRVRFREQVARYYQHFPKGQVKIIVAESFRADNAGVYRNVLEFLGVDPGFQAVFSEVNATQPLGSVRPHMFLTRAARSRLVRGTVKLIPFQRWVREKLGLADITSRVSPIDPAGRSRLMAEFKNQVEDLSEYLGIALTRLWGYDKI